MSSNTGQNRRILVIDDNRSIHEDFIKILVHSQAQPDHLIDAEIALLDRKKSPVALPEFQIDSAFQGQEGFQLVEKALQDGRPYAMAFVDVRMPPGWDGIETIARLWQIDPDLQIVICTAYSDYLWEEMLEKFGYSDQIVILKKPFDTVEVLQLAIAMTRKWYLSQQAKLRLDDLEQLVQKRTLALQETNAELRESQSQLVQAQKMEAVGRLAGGIAHDFNNLLTVISGYCSLSLQNIRDAGELDKNIAEIQRAADRAASLTRQLLAFSRKQVLQPRVLQINDTIHDMEKMLGRLIGEDIEMFINLDPAAGRIRADGGQIEQVIMNLAINARDAMPDGGKLVLTSSNAVIDQKKQLRGRILDPGEYIVLTIADDGHGMDEETKARLFEPFFTTKGLGKGTGLGLATCYGIICQSGGDIEVVSEPGAGATFKIFLPRCDAPVHAPVPAVSDRLPTGTESILIVEDDPAVRILCAAILQECGYTVLEAENALEALTLIQSGPQFDMVITDVIMPQMSGKELYDHIKRRAPRIEVLMMSGYTNDALAPHGVLDEKLAFLEKPFSPEKLAKKVRAILDAASITAQPSCAGKQLAHA